MEMMEKTFLMVFALFCFTIPLSMGHLGHHEGGETYDQVSIDKVEKVSGLSINFYSKLVLNRRKYTNLTEQSPAKDLDIFYIEVEAYGQKYYVHLEPNEDLLHSNIDIQIQSGDGLGGQKTLQVKDIGVRLYKGRVFKYHMIRDIHEKGYNSPYLYQRFDNDEEVGHARIAIHKPDDGTPLKYQKIDEDVTIDGFFTVNGEYFHVKRVETYRSMRRNIDADLNYGDAKHIIYRDRDQDFSNKADGNGNNATHYCETRGKLPEGRKNLMRGTLFKRANAGCPSSKKIMYMGVAADCTYVSNYGGEKGALKQILSNWNQASQLYETSFNVQLGIIQVVLRSVCGGEAWNRACSDNYQINQRLDDFSQWRGTQNADAGLWELMSQCATGPTVGVSWLGAICRTNAQGNGGGVVSGTGISTIIPNEWLVVAHEIGHSFGAIHDCTGNLCANNGVNKGACCPCEGNCDCGGNFIMNPTSDVKSSQFSPCSIRTVCGVLAASSCLADPGTRKTVTGNICGNGVKEGNEQCDCGPADGSDCQKDPCCDGATCTLKAGAQCADFNDLCCSQCKLKPANTVCRPSTGICDNQEVCPGDSGDCPPDSYVPDLQECAVDSNTQGTCASGQCTSRDLQCRQKGSSIGITGECSGYSDRCTLACQGRDSGSCIVVSGFFLDGTPCSYKGICKQGECQTTGINGLIGWFMSHMAIGIALLVVIIILIIFCTVKCFKACMRNKARASSGSSNQSAIRQARMANNRYPAEVFLAPAPGGRSANNQVPPAVPIQQQSRRPANWVDPSLYNGSNDEVDLSTLGPSSDIRGGRRGSNNNANARPPAPAYHQDARRSYHPGQAADRSSARAAANPKRVSTPPERIRTDVTPIDNTGASNSGRRSPRKRALKTPKLPTDAEPSAPALPDKD